MDHDNSQIKSTNHEMLSYYENCFTSWLKLSDSDHGRGAINWGSATKQDLADWVEGCSRRIKRQKMNFGSFSEKVFFLLETLHTLPIKGLHDAIKNSIELEIVRMSASADHGVGSIDFDALIGACLIWRNSYQDDLFLTVLLIGKIGTSAANSSLNEATHLLSRVILEFPSQIKAAIDSSLRVFQSPQTERLPQFLYEGKLLSRSYHEDDLVAAVLHSWTAYLALQSKTYNLKYLRISIVPLILLRNFIAYELSQNFRPKDGQLKRILSHFCTSNALNLGVFLDQFLGLISIQFDDLSEVEFIDCASSLQSVTASSLELSDEQYLALVKNFSRWGWQQFDAEYLENLTSKLSKHTEVAGEARKHLAFRKLLFIEDLPKLSQATRAKEALDHFKAAAKLQPNDETINAGISLAEVILKLSSRDNPYTKRELANLRKGLLSQDTTSQNLDATYWKTQCRTALVLCKFSNKFLLRVSAHVLWKNAEKAGLSGEALFRLSVHISIESIRASKNRYIAKRKFDMLVQDVKNNSENLPFWFIADKFLEGICTYQERMLDMGASRRKVAKSIKKILDETENFKSVNNLVDTINTRRKKSKPGERFAIISALIETLPEELLALHLWCDYILNKSFNHESLWHSFYKHVGDLPTHENAPKPVSTQTGTITLYLSVTAAGLLATCKTHGAARTHLLKSASRSHVIGMINELAFSYATYANRQAIMRHSSRFTVPRSEHSKSSRETWKLELESSLRRIGSELINPLIKTLNLDSEHTIEIANIGLLKTLPLHSSILFDETPWIAKKQVYYKSKYSGRAQKQFESNRLQNLVAILAPDYSETPDNNLASGTAEFENFQSLISQRLCSPKSKIFYDIDASFSNVSLSPELELKEAIRFSVGELSSKVGSKKLAETFAIGPKTKRDTAGNFLPPQEDVELLSQQYRQIENENEKKAGHSPAKYKHITAADIVHFSTHATGSGSFDNQAKIKLSNRQAIYFENIGGAFKNVGLVFLAGCETSSVLGSSHLSGAKSLVDGFLQQGCDAVIGTMWVIPDAEAADFTKEFYFAISNSKSYSEMLHKAVSSDINKNRLNNIDCWASFQCFGR